MPSAHRSMPSPVRLAVAAVASTALTVATTLSAQTSGTRLFALTRRDLGTGLLANTVALLGWDAIYYWNHRFNHESRWLWAMHVVHHSSERYNSPTALRQPVAEGLTMSVPYGLLALAGVRPPASSRTPAPSTSSTSSGSTPRRCAPSAGSRTCSTRRPTTGAHHGTNRQYLDRNHGSILILWDRLFGTSSVRTSESSTG